MIRSAAGMTLLIALAILLGPARAPAEEAPPPLDATVARRPAEVKASQEAWAKHLAIEVETQNSLGMKLRLIPPGRFRQGSTAEEVEAAMKFDPAFKKVDGGDEVPARQVRITKPFLLGATEVTRGQFRKFVTETSYVTEPERDKEGGWGFRASTGKLEGRSPQFTWRSTGFPQNDSHPVVNVTWNDAVAFCQWLSRSEGRDYRLPTEAEWEYACRAGTLTPFQTGEDREAIAKSANVADGTARAKFKAWSGLTAKDGYVFTAPAGRLDANAFGLFDMHGNVCEWCEDRYGGANYGAIEAIDPKGPPAGDARIFRGGGWNNSPGFCRSAIRRRYPPSDRYDSLGFRVAASIPDR